MITVRFTNDRVFMLVFKHVHPKNDIRSTFCDVYRAIYNGTKLGRGALVGNGIAKCDNRDNFNRAFGRKLALRRAMENMNWNKDERTIAWQAYLNRDTKVSIVPPDSGASATVARPINTPLSQLLMGPWTRSGETVH